MEIDQSKIFLSWKSDCMSLGAERFKASMGRELLRDLFNRWQMAVGSLEGIVQYKADAVAVLSIKSQRADLVAKYTGWTDRLKSEFHSLMASRNISSATTEGDWTATEEYWKFSEARDITGLPYSPYSSLIDAWVRCHYRQQVIEHYARTGHLSKTKEILVELKIQWLILEGHRFRSEVREAFDKHVGVYETRDAVLSEGWYQAYEATLPASNAEPKWFQVCRECFPTIFQDAQDGGSNE